MVDGFAFGLEFGLELFVFVFAVAVGVLVLVLVVLLLLLLAALGALDAKVCEVGAMTLLVDGWCAAGGNSGVTG